MARVAVVGGTGGIGRHVVRRAAAAGHEVRALARHPSRVPVLPGVTPMVCDVRDPAAVKRSLEGVEVVLSCLGNDRGRATVTCEGTQNLLNAAGSARKLVAISSVGVGDSHGQSLRMSWFFTRLIAPTMLRRPFADLERMERAMRAHPLTTVVVRPVGLTNGRARGDLRGLTVDEDVGSTVSRDDVAAFMVSLIEDDRWDGRSVTVGPPRSSGA